MNNRFWKLCGATAMVVTLAGCGGFFGGTDNSGGGNKNQTVVEGTQTKTGEKIFVAIDVNNPPFALWDKNGVPDGLDIELLNAIGEEQRLNFEFIPQSDWGAVFRDFPNAKYRLIASGATLTKERAQVYLPSQTYIRSYDVLAYVDPKLKIGSGADLKGLKVSVSTGGTQVEIAKKAGAEVVETTSVYNAFKAMATGATQVDMSEGPVVSFFLKDFPDLKAKIKVVPETPLDKLAADQGVLVFYARKNDEALIKKIDMGLEHLKQSGKYAQILQKWTGSATEFAVQGGAAPAAASTPAK